MPDGWVLKDDSQSALRTAALERFAAAPEDQSSNGLFMEYFDGAKKFANENPVTSTALAIGIVGGIALLSRGRLAARVLPAVDDVARLATGDAAAIAGKGLLPNAERSLVNGGLLRDVQGNAIPDVLRTRMPVGALTGGETSLQEALASASSAYRADAAKLWALPGSVKATAQDTLHTISRDLVSTRSAITGEALSEKAVGTQLTWLKDLNPALNPVAALDGATVVTYDAAKLTALTGDLRFRHVPQLGEFLGIAKAEQDACLAIQMTDRTRLLGQIFVEQKLATTEAVELAFARQTQWKQSLSQVQQSICAEQSAAFTALRPQATSWVGVKG